MLRNNIELDVKVKCIEENKPHENRSSDRHLCSLCQSDRQLAAIRF